MTKIIENKESEQKRFSNAELKAMRESAKEKVFDSIISFKNKNDLNELFSSYDELLPQLFTGWMASDECSSLLPHLRAQISAKYHNLLFLLIEVEQVISELPAGAESWHNK